jgi:mxaA protein
MRILPLLLGFHLLLTATLPASVSAATAIQSIDIRMPRPFGYVIGDVIEQEVDLVLNKPYRLAAGDSFSAPGRLTQWLEFYPPRIDHRETATANSYSIVLSYQIVNITPGVDELATPEQKLRFTDDQGMLSALIPAWRFRVAMLSAPGSPAGDLRPDRLPPVLTPHIDYLFWIAAPGLLIALAGLLVIYAYLPFLKRHNGPFHRACRRLRTLKAHPWDAEHYRQALRTVHEAFNQTLDKTVFVDELDDFFARQPRFAVLRQPIEQYFRHSRSIFFNDHPAAAPSQPYSLPALLSLCRECRDIERGLR